MMFGLGVSFCDKIVCVYVFRIHFGNEEGKSIIVYFHLCVAQYFLLQFLG